MASEVTYKLSLKVPKKIRLPFDELFRSQGKDLFDWETAPWMDRDSFYCCIWEKWGEHGLLGVDEGMVDAQTDVFDLQQGPENRDWVGLQDFLTAGLYFSQEQSAHAVARWCQQIPDIQVGLLQEQKPADWNAVWREHFISGIHGFQISPFWKVIPVGETQIQKQEVLDTEAVQQERSLWICPGAGFGTGTHETTQLCLEVIGQLFLQKRFSHFLRGLDFGCGSGILSIAMALLGLPQVDAIEIDPLALKNAQENARINGVSSQICFSESTQNLTHTLTSNYGLVVANLLKPLLLEQAWFLSDLLSSQGVLVLSGLLEEDGPDVVKAYFPRLGSPEIQVKSKGPWRALVFLKGG